jgi:hypothetical protein
LNKLNNIIGLLFFLLNAVFLWTATKISEFIVSLYRLDETRNYMLTQAEEIKIFFTHSIILLLIQCFILLMITAFWFVFRICQFTINGH